MSKVEQLREKLAAKNKELHAIFQAHSVDEMPAEEAVKIKPLNDEITAISIELDEAKSMETIQRETAERERKATTPAGGELPVGSAGGEAKARAFGDVLRKSADFAAMVKAGGKGTAVLELSGAEAKTLMTLTTINNPATRLPGIIESAQEHATVRDMMLDGSTDNNTITYMEETTFTNNAAEVAEGGTKPEGAIAFTERTDNVRKIATWIPVTTELLADVAGIQSYIEGRLRFMVKRREELQLLVGDGTAPNISGILDRVGIQTQAKGADPTPDAVYKAMTLIEVNAQADPDGVVFHPTDWQDVRLLRTADGIYIWGSPADVGPDRIWGLPVRKTSAMTLNTALVGAFKPFSQVFQREGITITLSSEHSTFFVENKVAVLAEERLALAVYRPAAFCTVTGV